MLYREIIAVCSEIHTKHTNTLCVQNVEFVNVKPGGTYSDHWALYTYWIVPQTVSRNVRVNAVRDFWRCVFYRQMYFIYLNINQLNALTFIMTLFHASTCFEHTCSSSGGQNYTIQSLVSSHSVGGRPVHRTATYKCDDTRDCIIEFWPPDDEHRVLETCRGMK